MFTLLILFALHSVCLVLRTFVPTVMNVAVVSIELYTPLYKKGIKITQNKSMETTLAPVLYACLSVKPWHQRGLAPFTKSFKIMNLFHRS